MYVSRAVALPDWPNVGVAMTKNRAKVGTGEMARAAGFL